MSHSCAGAEVWRIWPQASLCAALGKFGGQSSIRFVEVINISIVRPGFGLSNPTVNPQEMRRTP